MLTIKEKNIIIDALDLWGDYSHSNDLETSISDIRDYKQDVYNLMAKIISLPESEL